jgi:ribosomal protein L5
MRLHQNSNTRINLVDRSLFKVNTSNTIVGNTRQLKQDESSTRVINVHWSSKAKGFQPTAFGPEIHKLMKSTGQRPCVTLSNKGVARLGIRQGARTGIKVTLRGRNKFRYHRAK